MPEVNLNSFLILCKGSLAIMRLSTFHGLQLILLLSDHHRTLMPCLTALQYLLALHD